MRYLSYNCIFAYGGNPAMLRHLVTTTVSFASFFSFPFSSIFPVYDEVPFSDIPDDLACHISFLGIVVRKLELHVL